MRAGRNIRRRLLQKEGLTLIETVIVLLIAFVVFMLIFTIYNISMNVYKKTEEQIDAQSQFRLIIGILEKEVGTATEVELLHMEDIPDLIGSGYKCIYVKTDGDYGTFYSRTSAGEEAYITPYPLKDLSMNFRRGTNKNVLEVFLHAKDTNDYYGSILTQNAQLIYIDQMEDYEAVYFKVIDK
ncbi:MAG: PulJ/GspJ family protein [Anaerovoracaceae bacterium]|jgi:type II secretory pathway component PulJ